MKKYLFLIFLSFSLSLADEITAYKVGFVDGFRVGYSLKKAKRVRIPTGYWLYIPTENLPFPLIAFYVFFGEREGFKVKLSDDAVVFGVYERKADADFYRRLLESKGIQAYVEYREGREGWKGYVYNEIYEPKKYGVEGVYFHLKKAIERAREIDPTVLNRDLLIKDLERILAQIEKWKRGEKGYERVLEDRKSKNRGLLKEIKKFLEER